MSLKKKTGSTNPKMFPNGIDKAPIVVAIAHSLSPNHTIATFDGPEITKAIPHAATVYPASIHANPFSTSVHPYQIQAPNAKQRLAM